MTNYDEMFKPSPYDMALRKYIRDHVEETNKAPNTLTYLWYRDRPEIEKVIFDDPATIVFWSDGTKTVVKRQDYVFESFDKEKGLAMAISKKFLGNRGNYYNVFKRFLEEEE